jgi:putative salt-induced outer membrane protein
VLATLVFTAILTLLCVASAHAQEPAKPPEPPPPPPKLEGTAEVAYLATTGNTDTRTLGIGGTLTARPDTWLIEIKEAFIRTETNDLVSAKSFLHHIRASRPIKPRVLLFAQHGYLRDLFAGVSHRNVVEGGLSFLVVDVPRQRLRLDAGLGYLNEQRVTGSDISTMTALAGAGYKLKLSETSELTDDLGVLLSFADADDWRLTQVFAVTSRLTTLFALKASNTIRFTNVPAPGFERTDTITSIALVAKF